MSTHLTLSILLQQVENSSRIGSPYNFEITPLTNEIAKGLIGGYGNNNTCTNIGCNGGTNKSCTNPDCGGGIENNGCSNNSCS